MAKRRSRSEANESAASPAPGAGTPARPAKSRRARASGAAARRGAEAAEAPASIDSEATASINAEAPASIDTEETFAARAAVGETSPKDASASDTRSASMASEPSEEQIRIRAYQRYLERGAGDGRHFEDWLEAEKELKTSR